METIAILKSRQWVKDYHRTAYIVGGGPSLLGFDWTLLNGRFCVAINRAYEVLPDAHVVYFTDDDWYREHRERLLKHNGLKVKGSLRPDKFEDEPIYQFHLIGESGLSMEFGKGYHGRNSPYAATNMMVQWGFRTIYLLGIDMKWNGRRTHWHSGHKRTDKEHVYDGMRLRWKEMLPLLVEEGVEVINVNCEETLEGYRTIGYGEI